MAVLSFAGDERRVDRDAEVAERLREFGVEYERWDLSRVGEDASAEEVLAAYALEIEAMKERGGYTTADVIDIVPETPGLEAMLARFDKEHTHSEDEVRFILAGRGIFFLNVDGEAGGEAASGDESGAGRRVLSVEVHAGDMLRVPRGTTHWFTLMWGAADSGDPVVSEGDRVDAGVHGFGGGPGASAAVFWAGVPGGAGGDEVRGMSWGEGSGESSGVGVYLLDVEGTTSPISLVYEQLFPYARRHLASFLRAHADEADVREDLRLLEAELAAEGVDGYSKRGESPAGVAGAAEYLEWLMDRDRKSTALKSIQGKIWKTGFLSGELRGTVFEDVPGALRRWGGKARVAIYSSGSVEAQELLFRYSTAGDLTAWIAAYFDTRTGAKTAAASYGAIAEAMGVEAGQRAVSLRRGAGAGRGARGGLPDAAGGAGREPGGGGWAWACGGAIVCGDGVKGGWSFESGCGRLEE